MSFHSIIKKQEPISQDSHFVTKTNWYKFIFKYLFFILSLLKEKLIPQKRINLTMKATEEQIHLYNSNIKIYPLKNVSNTLQSSTGSNKYKWINNHVSRWISIKIRIPRRGCCWYVFHRTMLKNVVASNHHIVQVWAAAIRSAWYF